MGMPKARDYHLTEQELADIEAAIRRDKRPEVRQRCTVIRLLHLGYKPEQIAEMQSVSKPTIYGWYDRWVSGGVEGLGNRPKSGRPLKTDDAYTTALLEVIDKEPSEFGYDFAIWTIDRLQAHLEKKTGIGLSESRFRALLKRKGYRYRRPKYDLGHLQDKDAKAKAAEVLEELKKRSSETISNSSLWTKQP
jgi:transposase